MKIDAVHYIVRRGQFAQGAEYATIEEELRRSIAPIVWPPGAQDFSINPISNGNGVKPIKVACELELQQLGWRRQHPIKKSGTRGFGPVDMVRDTAAGLFGMEWETGNISSLHRSLNKLCWLISQGTVIAGTSIVASGALYPYLTDRIASYPEIAAYVPFFAHYLRDVDTVLAIVVVEHDRLDTSAPLITKGIDGMALLQKGRP